MICQTAPLSVTLSDKGADKGAMWQIMSTITASEVITLRRYRNVYVVVVVVVATGLNSRNFVIFLVKSR